MIILIIFLSILTCCQLAMERLLYPTILKYSS